MQQWKFLGGKVTLAESREFAFENYAEFVMVCRNYVSIYTYTGISMAVINSRHFQHALIWHYITNSCFILPYQIGHKDN